MLKVHSIETFGTHEGPGIRLVLFLSGCNFRCLYCHNPDTLDPKNGKKMTDTEIIKLAKKQLPYFKKNGGITVSGGEPTLQAKELLPLFRKLKKLGVHTALDTNGGIMNEAVKKLYDLTDLVIIDLKHIDPQKHTRLTGVTNTTTKRLIEYREKTQKPMWLRYVLTPGYTDDEQDLKKWASYIGQFKQIERVEILPYHNLGEYKYKELGLEYKLTKTKSPTLTQIKKAEKIFSKKIKQTFIR